MEEKKHFFRDKLLDWYQPEDRPLPWKNDKNTYAIWVSEIMLQQTRTDQVRPYYERFFEHFPDLQTLAEADEETVLHFWQGMGYYNRARNLLKAAKHIYFELKGKYPEDYQAWLGIPGVGPYTAAAITSFSYNQPNAVLDGNVFRVLSRYFGIDTPIDSSEGKKLFQELSHQLLDKKNPGLYNQAIMDFGATVCKARNPKCDICPFYQNCTALLEEKVTFYPIKQKKTQKKKVNIYYLHLTDGKGVFIKKRPTSGIWPGLYEFPDFESRTQMVSDLKLLFPEEKIKLKKTAELRHQLTHRDIQATIYQCHINTTDLEKKKDWLLVETENLPNFAFHQLMKKYFRIFNY